MKLKQFIFALVAMLSFSFSAFAQTTVSTAADLKAALESTTGGEFVLGGDITLPAQITVPKKTAHTLDLNGHNITGGIYVYGTLTINDNVGTGWITANTYVLNGAGGSKIILNGGRIYRGSSWSVYTTGVFVVNNGGKVENTIRVAGSGSIQLNGGTVTNVQVTSGNLNVSGSAVVNGNLNIETGAKGVNISAGTINGDITIATEVADKVTVSGGTFKDGEAVSEYMEEGKTVVKNEDGSYSVVDGLLKITRTGKCYPSLGDAFDAAVAGDVITLLDDVRVDDKYPTNQSKGITLDINGYTLSSYNNIHRVFDNGENGDITITNSKETGKIVGYSIRNKGQMRVQGVRLEFEDGIDCRGGDLYVDGCTIIGKKFAMQNDGGNTTVSNTTLSAKTYAIEHRVYGADKTFTIGEGVVIESGKVHTYDIDPGQNIVFPEGYFAATIQKYQTSKFTRAYYYCALPAAVEAVKNGGTVQVLSDVELKDILTLDKAVTLDGNGKTLTSAAGRAINVDCADVVNIQNLTIAGATGCERGINIINKAGTTNIDNVKVSGVSHYAVHVATSAGAAKVNIEDSNLTGWAAVAAYGDGGTVNVKNSNLVGVNTYAKGQNFATIAAASNIAVNVTGGKVTAESFEGKGNQNIVCGDRTGNVTTGASFTLDTDLELKGTAGYVSVDLDNNTVTVRKEYAGDFVTTPNATNDKLVNLTSASVAEINGTKYGSLQAAINAVKEGETIVVICDIELAAQDARPYFSKGKFHDAESYCGIVIPDDKAVTIDLNGKTVSYVDTYGDLSNVMVMNLGNLTINDAVGGGKLTYKPVAGTSKYSKYYSTIFNCGTLTINDGTVENTAEAETDVTNAVDNNSKLSHEYGNDCLLTVNGGTLSGAYYYAIRQYTHYLEGVKNRVVINGGDINGGVYMQHGDSWYYADPAKNRLNVDSYLTINDGNINTTADGTGMIRLLLNNPDNNAYGMDIKGGNINVPVQLRVQRGVYYTNGVSGATTPAETAGTRNAEWLEKNDGVISGGTFTEVGSADEPTKNVAAFVVKGYELADNGDGTYGIVKSPVAEVAGNGYLTLDEAIAAAKAGDEIKLLADVEGNVTLPAGVKFNGNGFAVSGILVAAGDITFAGVTKAADLDFEKSKTTVNIPEGASLQLNGANRMSIGFGTTFNITGTITDAKTADKATIVPSLVMPGASFSGSAGVTFNVTNAYISVPSSYCSSSKTASGTFDFNITNSIWESAGKFAFEEQSVNATVDFDLVNSVLTTGSHLVFGLSKGDVVIDNSNVNVGAAKQIENCGTMTIKNGSVVNGAVAKSSNAKNPGTVIVENATYAVTGEFSGSDLGTGNIVIKKDAVVSVGSIEAGANITIDAAGMEAGELAGFTADLSKFAGELKVINNDRLEAKIVDGKIVLVAIVAKIGDVAYETLQAAIDAVKNGETITLIADVAENVTVVQAPDVKFTIDGAEKTTMTGAITIDGKSEAYASAGVTIKNLKFNAANIAVDACINLSDGTTATRYTNNVTVENCTFTGGNKVKAAIKSYQGGDKNLTVTGCAVDNTMHSLIQAANIAGVVVDGCTVESKNGINLNSSSNVEIKNSTIDVDGYAVRAGVSGGTSGNIELANNTLKTNGTEDAVIVIRGTASEQINLAMSQNVVSGATHISGTTNKTKVSADANYWDGATAPVTSGTEVAVNSYYKDEKLEQLVRMEKGSIYAHVYADRIFGDVTTNAAESLVVEIIGADGTVIGTSTLEKPEHRDGTMKTLTWRINFGADDSGSWAMQWNEGAPSINNIPAKVRVMVDGKAMAEAAIKYTANGDGQSPVVAAKNAADGKFNFVVAEGKYNLDTAAETLNAAIAAGDNVAILAAGTYKVPTGKDLTITGAVEGVEFANIGAHNMGGANMTFNNVTFEYGNENYKGLQHAGNLVYNNCTFNGQVFLYGNSEKFNKCTFNQESADAYNVWTYGAKNVAFNECTFNSAGKSVLIYNESASVTNNVTVTKSQFIASQAVEGKAAIEMDSSLSGAISLTIDGETTASGFAAGNVSGNSLWNNKKGNSTDANNDITVVVNGETVLAPLTFVAKIGDNGYTALADAFAAVNNNETITLATDLAIDSETYTIADGKNVTLDMNGKKITVTDNKAGNNTQANYELFYIHGEMTVTGNGTIELTATNNREWNASSSIFHNRGGVLNIENGTFKHLGGTDMAYVIDNSGNWSPDATTNVKGGEIASSYIGIRNRMDKSDNSGKAILNVSGGKISGTKRAIWAQASSSSEAAPAKGEINVSGGEVGLIETARNATAQSMTTVTGGTVEAFKGEAGELKVTGGTVATVAIYDAAGNEIAYAVNSDGLYIAATEVKSSGTWGGIDWSLTYDGTLTIAPTAGEPVPDKNAPTKRTYKVGEWRETVVYNKNGGATSIGGAPYDMNAVKKLIIKEGVTKIGSFTCQFPNLTGEVVIPSTVTYFGQEAFHKTPITKLTFAAGGTEPLCIANGVFKKTLIEEVSFPGDRPSIEIHHWAFGGSTKLKTAYIPANLTKVWGGEHVDYFDNFNSQTNVSWTNIGSIFTGCTAMETITFETEEIRDFFFAGSRQGTAEDPMVAAADLVAYNSLDKAIAAATDDIILCKSATLKDTWTIAAGKDMTLNLNGKTLSQSKACTASYEMINNKGNLTITGNGKISFTDTSAGDPNFGWGSYTVRNEGNLVVENGTIEHKGAQAFAKHMICAIFQYSGSTTINGGTISTPNYRSARLWKGDMTINGGTFDGQLWVQAVDNSAKLTINGGTFEPNGQDASSVFVENKTYGVEFAVANGTFKGKVGCSDAAKLAGAIKGGKFNETAKSGTNTALLADGFIFNDELVDGYYAVVEGLAGEGTVENPYLISTVKQLEVFRTKVNSGDTKYNAPGVWVALGDDIDLAGAEWTVGIGDGHNYSFDGNFDGKNHTIKNLYIKPYADDSGYLCGGLFGYTYGAVTIKNLTIENAKVEFTGAEDGKTYHNVGVLVGFANNKDGKLNVDNVTVKGDIEVNAPQTYGVGAIVGYSYRDMGAITNTNVLANKGSYIKGERFVGGITGYSYNGAVIDNCTVENLAITGEIGVGGIAGLALNGNKIAGCTVKYVTVNGDKNVAYIVGELGSGDGGNVTVADNCNAPQPWVGGSYATGESFVATIGTQYYTSVAKAIEAAKENDVITLIADIAATDIITINKPVTLDGNGKTLTSTAGRAINVDCAGNVGIKNITINASGERAINVITKPANLTIEDVTATAANYTVNVATSAGAAKVAINNSNLTGLNVVNVAAAGAQVTVNGGTIVCNDQTDAESYAALVLNKDAKNGSIVATKVTFKIEGDSRKATNQAENGTITIDGSTEDVEQHVAYISYGSNWYGFATLEAAIAKANAGETVTLLRDINASAIVTIDKAITLDGNGKTLTSTAARAINVSGADGVTIQNLTINASGERAINVIQNATNVTIDGVTATAANYTVNLAGSAPNAVVAIKNSTLNGLCTVNVAAAGAKVTVDNSTVNCNDNNTTEGEAYAALSLNRDAVGGSIVASNTTVNVAEGSDSMKGRNGAENGTVTINGSTDGVAVMVAVITYEGSDYYHSFASLAKAVEFAEAGNVITLIRDITTSDITTINKNVAIDGNGKTLTYTGTDRAFQITGGTVAISNLTIDMPNAAEGNRGINLYNGGTNAALDVTLNKVTINGGKAYAVNIGGGKDNKLTINGSTLTGYAAINVHTSSVDHTIVVDGSTLNGKNHNNDYSFGTVVVDGTNAHSLTITNTTITTENLEGVTSKYDKVVVSANCTLNWDGGEAAVRSIWADSKKGKLYYTDLQTAIDDAAEVSGTVQILGNITATKSIAIPAAKKVTIDLNGKTITGTDTGTASYGLININPEAELTINDATGNGAIKLKATENRGWNAYSSVISNQRGKLTVNGGTIEHLGGTDMAYAIDNLTNTGAQNAETVINGGTIKSTYRAVRQFLNSATAQNILTVNGGTIEGTNKSIWMQDANANANPGALTVDADAMLTGDVYLTVTAGSTAWPVEVAIAAAALQGESKVLDNGNVPAGYDLALVDGVYGVYSGAAKIGTTYYATLAEAVKAVQEGETITILAGTHSEGTIKLPATLKNVTIEGAEGAVLKDMTISAADGNSYSYVGLTFDGITFDNSRLLFTGWRNGDEVIENLTVTNCTFKNLYDTTNTAPVHINKDASEPVNGFTFTNNVIDGATGGQKSGIYLQATGNVVVENNIINNVSFRPYVIQLTTDDGIADNFIVKGNTFSGSAVGRAQGLGNNAEGTDAVNLVISNNIFEGITDSQQICYWNFNAETTTTDFSKNYYDIENIIEKASRFYFNGAAADASDLIEMGIYPYYAALNEDGTIDESSLVEAPVAVIGTTGYTTLAEAVQAAVTGETVTLTDDVETSAAGYATIGKEKYAVIVAVKEKDITLDLNGKSVTVTPTAEELANAASKMLMSVFGMDTNGKLTLTGNGSVKVNANGATVYSLAAAYGEGAQLTINNGSYFVDEMPEATSLIYAQRSESVIINGGTYNIGNVGTLKNGSPWIFNTKGQNVDGIYVYGGTYPTDINHQFWFNEAIVPGHLAVKANEDGTSWSVVEAAAYTREVGRSTGSWRRNVGYATIEEAIAATQTRNCEGNVVTLAKNVEIEQMITVANGVEVTLDLNGKTLAATDNTSKNYSAIDNRGDLTIVDSSEGENEPGTGKITVTATVNSGWNRYSAVIANNPGGELTVMSGTIEHLGGTDMAYGIDNLTNGKGTHAVTEIYGGTVKSPYRAVRQFLNGVEANNTLAVYGGTLEGANKSIWMQDPSKNANTGNLYVGEEAVLNGDVYLTVTAGSTEWPVEAYIEKAALAEGKTVLVSNVPADAAALVEYDTFWQVEQKNLAELTIVDEDYTEYINKIEKNVETLTYVREFTGEWETIYLPFGFTITEEMAAEFEFAYIYNASYKDKKATIDVVEVGAGFALAANYPYMIRAKEAGENEIVVENAKLMPTKVETIDCSSIFEQFSFIGNYATVDADNLDATKGYFSLNGAWSKMETINPFRFYMQIALRNGDAFEYPTDPQAIRMRSVNANGETTGIDGVDAEQAGDFIFDIHGRRVLETEKGGIYIKNGKKFIAQ